MLKRSHYGGAVCETDRMFTHHAGTLTMNEGHRNSNGQD